MTPAHADAALHQAAAQFRATRTRDQFAQLRAAAAQLAIATRDAQQDRTTQAS